MDAYEKRTSFRGYLTGDHECALLFPEDRIPGVTEAMDRGLYLGGLMPDEVTGETMVSGSKSEYDFEIRVRAVPTKAEPISERVEQAAEAVEREFPDGECTGSMKEDFYDPMIKEPTVEATLPIENTRDWQTKRDRVREIASDFQKEGELIYTHVDRKRTEESSDG